MRFGLVSDIDDTVITTMLPRPMIAAFNTFVRRGKARHAVPGMAPMYRRLLAAHPGAPIVYVSTGAWNTAATLNRFLLENGFPLGPLLLTDWGPTNTGLVPQRAGPQAHLPAPAGPRLPRHPWLLVGDDGQHDPQLYAEFAEARPDRVDAICIRHLSPTEQVLSNPMKIDAPSAHDGSAHRADLLRARRPRPAPHARRAGTRRAGRWPSDEQPSRPQREPAR